jgi:hypothetical protein
MTKCCCPCVKKLKKELDEFLSKYESFEHFQTMIELFDEKSLEFKESKNQSQFHHNLISPGNEVQKKSFNSSDDDPKTNYFYSYKLKYKSRC